MRHVNLAVSFGELETEKGVGVVPAYQDPPAPSGHLADLPEELPEARQILTDRHRALRAMGGFDADERYSRLLAGQELPGQQPVAPLHLLQGVGFHVLEDVLRDEQLVRIGPAGSLFAPATWQPEQGSVHGSLDEMERPLRVFLGRVFGAHLSSRRPHPSGEAAQKLRQSPLGHGPLGGFCRHPPRRLRSS
jgi:hypothetical protein